MELRRPLLIAFSLTFWGVSYSQSGTVPGTDWMLVRSPEQVGWSAEKIENIHQYVKEIGSTSMMIVQHGVVVAEWGDISRKSNLHSCRKSLLNALIGIAKEENKIHLDDTLAKLGIDDKPPSLSPVEKQATVRDLLESRSGIYHPAVYETKGMEEKRPLRGSHVPGSYWYYNNWDFNALGFIYEHATGQRIFEAFYQKVALPIGMQDFLPSDGRYITAQDSIFSAYVFAMSARDFARFGLLYLRQGKWNGNQVIPEDWVRTSMVPYSDTESGGYGYLWWTGDSTGDEMQEIAFPKGSFWAEGHLGQYAVIVPSLDLIVVNRLDERLTKRTIHKQQMAHLVRLVVNAAPQK